MTNQKPPILSPEFGKDWEEYRAALEARKQEQARLNAFRQKTLSRQARSRYG